MRSSHRYNARVRRVGFYSSRLPALLRLCWVTVAVSGCGPSTDIRLVQPQLTGRQGDLHLMSEQVHWAAGEGVERVLAEFPLPGATTGRIVYLLYLRLPAGEKEPTVSAREPPTVRGFFIQTRGKYAGKASVVGGKVVVRGASQSSNATRQLDLELTCEDGTRIAGRLQARRDDYQVRYFEVYRRPADVQALEPPPAASDTES